MEYCWITPQLERRKDDGGDEQQDEGLGETQCVVDPVVRVQGSDAAATRAALFPATSLAASPVMKNTGRTSKD